MYSMVRFISGSGSVSLARLVTLLGFMFELSHLNDQKMETLRTP